jgi:hypothetical protein
MIVIGRPDSNPAVGFLKNFSAYFHNPFDTPVQKENLSMILVRYPTKYRFKHRFLIHIPTESDFGLDKHLFRLFKKTKAQERA